MCKNNTKENKNLTELADSAECGLIKIAYNSEMTILYANEYFYTLHGYSREEYTELFNTNALARIHPNDLQRFKASVARQLSMGTALRFEYRVIKKDGSISWLLINGKMTTENQQIAYLCSCMDITTMKVSYQDLAKSKLELDILSNNIPGGVAKIRSNDFKLLYANNSFYQISGYSRLEYEEQFDNVCLGLLHEDDILSMKEKIDEAIKNKTLLSMEYRILHKSGQIRWSYLNASLIEGTDDAPVFLCVIVDITMQKEYEQQLELAQEKHQILAELTNETLWEYNVANDQLIRSGKLEDTFSQESVLCNFLEYLKEHSIIHSDDINTFRSLFKPSKYEKKKLKIELRMKNNIGIYTWYQLQGIVMFDKDNSPSQVIGKSIDIDTTKQQFLKLQEEASRDELTQLFNQSAILEKADALLKTKQPEEEAALLLIDLDHFKIIADHYGRLITDSIISKAALLINDTLQTQFIGRIDNDQFVAFLPSIASKAALDESAQTLCKIISEIQVDGSPDLNVTCSIGYFTTKEKHFTYELMLLRANVALRTMKSRGGNGVDAYGTLKNTPMTSTVTKKDIKRSYYDGLTGLYTLPAFIIEADRIIQAHTKKEEHFAILCADINHFKVFNLNYGLSVGNKILKYFGRVLEEELLDGEICCHNENDHFVCLLKYKKPTDLSTRFNKLKDRLMARDTNIEDYFRFTITCGVYSSIEEKPDVAYMIDKADFARKSTKGLTEVSHYALYTKELEAIEKSQLALETSIEAAMENGEIVPYLQPKYALSNEQLVAAEALIRWVKPDGTILLPKDFLPLLERNGFIVELDFYIIEQTLKIIKGWLEQKRPVLPVAFNISGAHLKTSNFVERIVALMKQYSIPISYLELEIAESVYVKHAESLTFLIEELTDVGFKITIDDFGKAYTAINCLKNLPLHAIKLDTAFFHGKIQHKKESIVFKKIIEIAKEFGIFVLSEGVETTLQADLLKDFGCDIAQGFLYHNPMPVAEFEQYVLRNAPKE